MAGILEDIKKMLGYEKDYEAFDTDIKIFINLAFGNLFQLGALTEKYAIAGYDETWNQVPLKASIIDEIKPYIYLFTRLRFDPPTNSFIVTAIENQIKEAEWRINTASEGAFTE